MLGQYRFRFWRPFVLCFGIALMLNNMSMQSIASSQVKDAIDYEFNGRVDADILKYQKALQEQPNSVLIHLQLGQLLLDLKGDADGAITQFQTAIKIDPTCGSCRMRLEKALLLKEASSDELVLIGNQYYLMKEYKRAEALYHLAVQKEPKDAEAHNSLAWTLYKEDNLDDGQREINEALRLKPNDPEIINTLGCILYDSGNIDGALQAWNKAIALSPSPSPADLYCLAVALISQGDSEGAIKYFQQAVKKDPRYTNPTYLSERVGMSVKTLTMHDKLQMLLNNQQKPAAQRFTTD